MKRMLSQELIAKLQRLNEDEISDAIEYVERMSDKDIPEIIDVEDITAISSSILQNLKGGDIIRKVDSTGKHSYFCSFKKDGTGLCLTYTDASVVETVSYDKSGSNWVYNSTDITELGGGGGGTQLYKHSVNITYMDGEVQLAKTFEIITDSASQFEKLTSGGPPRISSAGNIISFDKALLMISYYNQKSIGTYYIYENNAWRVVSINDGTVNSDTVTPL